MIVQKRILEGERRRRKRRRKERRRIKKGRKRKSISDRETIRKKITGVEVETKESQVSAKAKEILMK